MSTPADYAPVQRLYTAHHAWLTGWLSRRVHDRSDAADLSQDTFLRVLSVPHQAEDLREPRAYLATIAKRLLANLYRRRSLEDAWRDALASLPDEQAPSAESQAAILEALNEVDQVLSKLSAKARQAFLMSQIEGYSQEEIALTLNISVRTVQRYLLQGFEECIVLASSEWL
ncbi:sigma-70 family RNA polymerase sigma factor [Pseudomonas sp. 21LCFQ010]|uniref:sigma-70 family RNA polymerase sigma factor n=1 Tax=Pseudomonas sp. 21LCFQ010 TaxID=2957506 RepID=UPI002096A2BF|nr:sigma-70 family RNA polymerase sigma factor [Pseudomonas sp. 21LCFQ010]MCO8164128.1 sigma-70 family RNA polymerase sigma factor [Pseudomonas sp. 21LCFQ010]